MSSESYNLASEVTVPDCEGQIWDSCPYRKWAEGQILRLDMQCRALIHELTVRRNSALEEAALACEALAAKNSGYGCKDCALEIRILKRPEDAPHS